MLGQILLWRNWLHLTGEHGGGDTIANGKEADKHLHWHWGTEEKDRGWSPANLIGHKLHYNDWHLLYQGYAT